LVEAAYQHGKALTSATTFELDDVIDPADTRDWVSRLLFRKAPTDHEPEINQGGGHL